MKIFDNIKKIKKYCKNSKKNNKVIGFVPTMGFLHEGHLRLLRKAKKECDIVILSIFVNPIQFGKNEDFSKYPRNIKKDISLAKKIGINAIFIPTIEEIFPKYYSTHVIVSGSLNENLCGKFRKGHFKGVTTIVLKLFNIINPNIAYFGQKDAQQLIIIKKMVKDLNIDINIKSIPIIREKDGLAMSSRNKYLSQKEREQALLIYKSLKVAKNEVKMGIKKSDTIRKKIATIFNGQKNIKINYIELVDINTLKPIINIKNTVLIALAIFVGRTRLIDNIILDKNGEEIVKL